MNSFQAIYLHKVSIMKIMKLFLPLLVVSVLSASVTGCIFDPFWGDHGGRGHGYGGYHHHDD